MLSYAADVKLAFGPLIRKATTRVAGTASAGFVNGGPAYSDLYLVLDVSASMGLAADAANRTKLKSLTKPLTQGSYRNTSDKLYGCAFACHIVTPERPDSFFKVARDNNVRLRIDGMTDATSMLLGLMRLPPGVPQAHRVAMYTFDSTVTRLLPLTSDLDLAAAKLGMITLGENTDPKPAFKMVRADIGSQGDGQSPATPRKTVVLVTDGLRGERAVKNSNHGFPVDACLDLRHRGFDIAVIDITYMRDELDDAFNKYVAPVYGEIENNLRQCATGGLYFQGSEPAEMNRAFAQMFRATEKQLSVLRLTK